MKFSKRNRYLLLSLLALLSVIIRVPVVHHAFGTDSFFIHGLATSISTFGYAKWVIHPMSLAGLYPLSYGSMYPFVLSGASICTNISIEYSILILGIVLSLFGMLSMYLVAKEMVNDDFFVFIVTFVYSMSPFFFFYTNWTATTRGVFMAVLPFLIYVLIKSHEKYRYIPLVLIMLLLLMTIHRLFYSIPLILIAYIGAIFLIIIHKKINATISFKILNHKIKLNINKSVILLPFIFIIGSFYVQRAAIGNSYAVGLVTETGIEPGFLKSFVNLLLSYSGRIGLVFFFIFPSFIYFIKREYLTLNELFLLLSTAFLTLVIFKREYTPIFFTLFISILIGYGIMQTYDTIQTFFKSKQRRKAFCYLFISLILCSSILYMGHLDNHWKKIGTNTAMSDESYNTALFVKGKTNNTCITNEGVIGQRIHAIYGAPILPFGGPSMHWYGPDQLIHDFENESNLHAKLLPIAKLLPSPPDCWYTFGGVSNAKADYQVIMYHNINADKVQRTLLKYNITNVILHKPLGTHFISYGRRDSNFIPTMKEQNSKIFDSNSEELWYLK